MPTWRRVTRAYRSPSVEPLVAWEGEQLRWERRETEWDGWLWCTHSSGRSGWAPEAWLILEGEVGVLLRDYDATELDVKVGDVLAVEFVEAGWAWAMMEKGESGWLPLEHVEP